MDQSYLPAIRQLAKNGAFSFSAHATTQMHNRDITYDDVESILISSTNQIIEYQSPSHNVESPHQDERMLLYDPCCPKDIIVIFVIMFVPTPDLRIVTVENVDNEKWERNEDSIPCLVRK